MTNEQTVEFRAIDFELARLVLGLAGGGENPPLRLAALLASHAVRLGHSCCRLEEWAGNGTLGTPPLDHWLAALRDPEVAAAVSGGAATPLVLDDGNRLYFQRNYLAEQTVAAELLLRASRPPEPPELPPGRLAALFGGFDAAEGGVNHQQLAVFAAASQAFTVITGGPGTGKTTVVSALLALERERNPHLRIMLTAPTGKAEARLREALGEAAAGVPGGTLHRLLEPDAETGFFRRNRDNPLACDLLIVDESSMIPLSLLAALLPALRPECRLVLLGDRDQLASVESGAVLADICDSAEANAFHPAVAEGFYRQTGERPETATGGAPLRSCIAELTVNYRFRSAPSIGRISRSIRQAAPGEVAALAAEIAALQEVDFATRTVAEAELDRAFSSELNALRDLPRLAAVGGEEELLRAFALLDGVQILTPLRRGPFGVEAINARLRHLLGFPAGPAPGLPILILENDRPSGLANGDTGILWPSHKHPGTLEARFPNRETPVPIADLPQHEEVFAMTVHKSQGSGFDHVLLLLPDGDNPLFSRELLYTGITRARKKVTLWSRAETIAAALQRQTLRHSGLASRLR